MTSDRWKGRSRQTNFEQLENVLKKGRLKVSVKILQEKTVARGESKRGITWTYQVDIPSLCLLHYETGAVVLMTYFHKVENDRVYMPRRCMFYRTLTFFTMIKLWGNHKWMPLQAFAIPSAHGAMFCDLSCMIRCRHRLIYLLDLYFFSSWLWLWWNWTNSKVCHTHFLVKDRLGIIASG